MAAMGDNFTVEQRQQYVVASMSIGIILSTVTLVARLWARQLVIHRLRIEDWLMVAGTVLSYGTAICMLWGMVLRLRCAALRRKPVANCAAGVLVTGLNIPPSSLSPQKRSESLLVCH